MKYIVFLKLILSLFVLNSCDYTEETSVQGQETSKASIDTLTQKVAKKKDKLKTLNASRENHRQQNESCRDELKTCKSETQKVTGEAKRCKDLGIQIQKTAERRKEKINDYREERKHLEVYNSNLELKNNLQRQEVEYLKLELQNALERGKLIEESEKLLLLENDRLKISFAELNSDYKAIQGNIVDLTEEKNNIEKKMKDEQNNLFQELTETKEQLKQSKANETSQKRLFEDSAMKITKLESKINKFKKAKKDQSNVRGDQEKKITELAERDQKLFAEFQTLSAKYNEAEKKILLHETERDQVEQEKIKLQQEADTLRQNLELALNNLNEVESERFIQKMGDLASDFEEGTAILDYENKFKEANESLQLLPGEMGKIVLTKDTLNEFVKGVGEHLNRILPTIAALDKAVRKKKKRNPIRRKNEQENRSINLPASPPKKSVAESNRSKFKLMSPPQNTGGARTQVTQNYEWMSPPVEFQQF